LTFHFNLELKLQSQYLFQTQAVFHITNKFWHFLFHFSDRNSNLQVRMVLQTERHKHRQKHWCSCFLYILVYFPWQPSHTLQSLCWQPSFGAISLTSNTNSMTISDTYIFMVLIYSVTNAATIIQITIL
jgi:hypothetical protein